MVSDLSLCKAFAGYYNGPASQVKDVVGYVGKSINGKIYGMYADNGDFVTATINKYGRPLKRYVQQPQRNIQRPLKPSDKKFKQGFTNTQTLRTDIFDFSTGRTVSYEVNKRYTHKRNSKGEYSLKPRYIITISKNDGDRLCVSRGMVNTETGEHRISQRHVIDLNI